MSIAYRAAAILMLVVPQLALAQHSGAPAAPATSTAPKEGTQFEFLVGQWEVTAQPKATTLAQRIHGVQKVSGTWKAWRAFDGWGIEDEIRLTDKAGNPRLLTHTTRYYETSARRWTLSAIDVYKGVVSQSTAASRTNEMLVNGRGTDEDGKAYLSRGTFSKITPASFSFRLDRSFDNGKTWTEGVTIIDAKRVAATAPR
jgi:hypothetical protein